MVDKLSYLGGVGNSSERPDKINKKVKTAESDDKSKKSNVKKVDGDNASGAQVKISHTAKELMKLRAEAARYLKMIESKETLSADDLEEIQQKLKNNHYLKEEVINKIVEKLVNLPNFKNI